MLGSRRWRAVVGALVAAGIVLPLLGVTGAARGLDLADIARAERAWTLRSEGSYEEAAELYRQLARTAAADREQAALGAAEAYLAAKDFARALELADAAAAGRRTAADAQLLRARALEGLGRGDEAEAALRTHLQLDPLGGYPAFLGGEWRWRQGDPTGAREWYTWALDLGLAPLWEVVALRRVAESYEQEGVPAAAAIWYERAARRAGEVQEMGQPVWFDGELARVAAAAWPPELLLQAATTHRQAGALQEAAEVYWELASTYPSSAQAPAALDALAELGRYYSVEPYYRGRVLLQAGRPVDAAEAFSKARAGQDSPSIESAAAYYGALAWRDGGDPLRAIDELAEMARQYPASPLAPEALWQRARLIEALVGSEEARLAYVDVADRFPSSDRAAQGLLRAARLALAAGDGAGARALWQRLGAEHPDPIARAQGLFWLGRGLLERGDRDGGAAVLAQAEQLAPRSFEGLRARDLRLGGLGSDPLSPSWTTALAQPPETDYADCQSWLRSWASGDPEASPTTTLQRVDRLLAVGLLGPAQAEALAAVARAQPFELHTLAYALSARRLYPVSIAAASRLATLSPARSLDGSPPCLQRVAYPLAYADLVEREAKARGLDPYLLLALLRQESWFGPHARSPADALGLSQVIPTTAQEIARALGRNGFQLEDLLRPREGILFGSWYLARQLQDLGQRPLLALAAYNAGPGNAWRWAGGAGRIDPDDFVQAIDFAETRSYVRTIYETYHRYRELYG